MRFILAIPLFLLSTASLACFTLPKEKSRPHASLINEASSIVLISVTALPNGACTLKISKVLSGVKNPELSVACRLPKSGDWMTDFSGHSDNAFWSGAGRLGINGDCSVISPAFIPGKTYLGFLGIAPDVKQYEQIDGTSDRWLKYVTSLVRKPLSAPN